MEIYKFNSLEEITDEVIVKLIEKYKINEVPRLKKLNNYYLGKTKILERKMKDEEKPNNKIVTPIASTLVDTVQGYFLGKPVTYASNEEETMMKIQEIFDNNDEQNHNARVGKEGSKIGLGYELLYMNENSEIKFGMIPAEEGFIIYDNSIEMKPLMGVRFYDSINYITEETQTNVILYTDSLIIKNKIDGEDLVQVGEETHPFGGVPINPLKNNDELMGDFEKVIHLIDAYDLAVSDTSNNIEYFADAYLMLTGIEGEVDEEAFKNMKENRILVVGQGGDGKWLVKGSQDMELEEFKNRLMEDIHKTTHIPNISDETFGNAASGESLKYKLFDLENYVSIKERHFRSFIERRIKLITNVLNIMNESFNSNDVTMYFTRNLPAQTYSIQDVRNLVGMVSNRTLLSLLPFVDDVAYEIQLLKEELEDSLYDMNETIEQNTQETTEEEI